MKWTNEPPKEPGWYYFRTGKESKIEMAEVFIDDMLTIIKSKSLGSIESRAFCGVQTITHLFPECQWSGPIPEPEE